MWLGVVFCILIIAAVAGLIYVWEVNKPKQPVPAESSEGYLFTSDLAPPENETIVIQCDEERYQNSFNDFVAEGLKEEKADVVGVT